MIVKIRWIIYSCPLFSLLYTIVDRTGEESYVTLVSGFFRWEKNPQLSDQSSGIVQILSNTRPICLDNKVSLTDKIVAQFLSARAHHHLLNDFLKLHLEQDALIQLWISPNFDCCLSDVLAVSTTFPRRHGSVIIISLRYWADRLVQSDTTGEQHCIRFETLPISKNHTGWHGLFHSTIYLNSLLQCKDYASCAGPGERLTYFWASVYASPFSCDAFTPVRKCLLPNPADINVKNVFCTGLQVSHQFC